MSRINKRGREVDGVVLLDKDLNISSNEALIKVKKLFFAKKAGHTGSLDPLASGILPICMGHATKVSKFLLAESKRYFVCAKLGQVTETGDAEGKVISEQDFSYLKEDKIINVIKEFVGNIAQIPPMYSALKKDGKPLYKLARKGIVVNRQSRLITIYKIDYLSFKDGILCLEVTCSKGTYIRVLIEDIGNRLGCGAYVAQLRRVGFAHFDIDNAYKLSTLLTLKAESYTTLDKVMLTISDTLPNFASVYLNSTQSNDIRQGRKIVNNKELSDGQTVKLFDAKNQLLAIGLVTENLSIIPKRLLV